MELSQVVPKMQDTFGTLKFLGTGKVDTAGFGRNVRVTSRQYNLASSIQRADNISVNITGNTTAKTFEFKQEIILVNPVIKADGENVQGRGFVDYVLYADDIIAADEVKQAAEPKK